MTFKTQRTYESVEEWIKEIPRKAAPGSQAKTDPQNIIPLATHGWPEGVQLIRKYIYDVDNIIGKRIDEPAINWDVTGLDFDMGAALSGNPECWYDFKAPEHKLVRILFNPSAAGVVSQKSLALRGAMIAGLVDSLERAGHRTEVYMVYGNTGPSIERKDRVLVKLKAALDPLDIDRIAFFTCHEMALRSLWFTYVEQQFNYRSGLWLYRLTDIDKAEFDVCNDRLDDEMNETQVMVWIKEQLKKFGIELTQKTQGD